MVFCAIALLARPSKSQLAWLYIALMLSSSFYLFGHITNSKDFYPLYLITFIAGNSLLGIFWLVSLCLFSDHIKVTAKHYFIASLPLLFPSLLRVWSLLQAPPVEVAEVVSKVVMVVELSLILHALTITLKYWRDDLIQQRRFLRASLICFVGIYLFLVIFLEQVLQLKGSWLTQIESGVLAGLSLFLNFFLLQLREMSLFPSNEPQHKKSHAKKHLPEVEPILAAMTERSLYQQEGLTITELAKMLNMYEYKLRNVINGELGYRNFNDFLNDYRIKEVTAKLQDPKCSSIAILNLALDSGFRSLSSFNKAFKDKHQVTPSEFRKRYVD